MAKKKKLHIDFRGIRFLNWVAFAAFGVIIIAFLWLTQVVYLDNYVESTKRTEFGSLSQYLRYPVGDYHSRYDTIAEDNACNITVYRVAGDSASVEYSSMHSPSPRLAELFLKTSVEGEFKEDSVDKLLLYGFYTNDTCDTLVVISQSNALMQSTSHILKLQMIIATVIILILSVCVSVLMSTMFSYSLRNLSSTAHRLIQDDYSVVFEEKGFTEVKELAAALNYATAEMKKTEDLRRELLANVSHDLRTPLTIIKGYAEMMRDLTGADPVRRTEGLDIIIKETDRLSGLVGDLLALSREQNTPIEKSPCHLDVLVEESLATFGLSAERDGYVIEKDIQKDCPIVADAAKLKTAIYNLIGNAINYTGADKHIYVSVKELDGEYVFSVRDTGEGLDEEQCRHIWQRYWRSGTHKRSVVGTGLGLHIVQAALLAHEARYGVDSKPGEGSNFWFALPKAE